MLSRLTKRAVASLGVISGQPVWLQVKSTKNRPEKGYLKKLLPFRGDGEK
ncbi:TOBE domain-containing protein [Undibacterium sp. FT147W]|uniref:TOBE domain-containing protein n=1 Tax=Undibacterium rivi TaxID=2828729 RepID=A0ABS5H0E0_9BURK|nr:TOBE domain-containing protein [Undibacterium rivi]